MAAFEVAFGKLAKDRNVVTQFLRLHPFLPLAELGLSIYEMRKHQDNVIVPTSGSIEAIRENYTSNRRRRVRQGRRHGLTMEFDKNVEAFHELYIRSMDRLEAEQEYYFPISFLQAALEFGQIAWVKHNGDVCSAYLLLYEDDVVYLYLVGTVPEKLPLRPNDFGFDEIIRVLNSQGLRFFHLGGGADTLLAHKQSFSPQTVPYYHLRRVFDDSAYAELIRLHGEHFGRPPLSGFFPAYRDGFR